MSQVHFVVVRHLGLAGLGALLFFLGAGLGILVVRRGPRFLTRMPMGLFRLVRSLIGPEPGLVRLALVIFGFNGSAMFLYMASGLRPLIPELIAVLTGFDIAVILLLAGAELDPDRPPWAVTGEWVPAKWLTAVCGVAVLTIELPCFWYAIAMGISLGQEAAGGTGYLRALSPRAWAYARLLLPALFLSAVCESVAIRGMQALSAGPQKEDPWPGQG